MQMLRPSLASVASIALLLSQCAAQTSTSCDPLDTTCDPDEALGTTVSIDFTEGASSDFTANGYGPISYTDEGVQFEIAESGDSPLITSNWYIMFGKVEAVIKAAPGVGIVSSSVLISDDLDEIDWEWLGAYPDEVQTNYFGKGITGDYNRGTTVSMDDSQSSFHTYTVDWTSERIIWEIDGVQVRLLEAADAETNQYPQTPMQVKIGEWSGGDSSNSEGTIEWAGGETNYTDGPFYMYLKSITVTDYSTGTEYKYGNTSGSWESIVAVDGEVNGNLNSASASATSTSTSSSSAAAGSSSSSAVESSSAAHTTTTTHVESSSVAQTTTTTHVESSSVATSSTPVESETSGFVSSTIHTAPTGSSSTTGSSNTTFTSSKPTTTSTGVPESTGAASHNFQEASMSLVSMGGLFFSGLFFFFA